MRSPALLGAGGTEHSEVAEDVLQGDAGVAELQLLGGGGHARSALLELAAGADVAVDLHHKGSMGLWRARRNGGMSVPGGLPERPLCTTTGGSV